MRISIHFYLKGKEETEIVHEYDATHLFELKKGDHFWFSVSEMSPKAERELAEKLNVDIAAKVWKDNENLRIKFNNKEFKIVSVYRAVEKNINFDDSVRLTLEYKCKIVKHIYWRFWRTYKFKQFIGKYK